MSNQLAVQVKTENALEMRKMMEKERRSKLIKKSTKWYEFRQKKDTVIALYL